MDKTIPKNDCKVKLKLITGDTLYGTININGFDRLSDLVNNNDRSIKLYRTIIGGKHATIIISKINILWYEPR